MKRRQPSCAEVGWQVVDQLTWDAQHMSPQGGRRLLQKLAQIIVRRDDPEQGWNVEASWWEEPTLRGGYDSDDMYTLERADKAWGDPSLARRPVPTESSEPPFKRRKPTLEKSCDKSIVSQGTLAMCIEVLLGQGTAWRNLTLFLIEVLLGPTREPRREQWLNVHWKYRGEHRPLLKRKEQFETYIAAQLLQIRVLSTTAPTFWGKSALGKGDPQKDAHPPEGRVELGGTFTEKVSLIPGNPQKET